MKRLATEAVVLDGAGAGDVQLGPVPTYTTWHAQRITVQATDTTVPRAYVYFGSIEPGNLLDATYTGSLDASDLPPDFTMPEGTSLFVRWVGGTPATNAVATLTGQEFAA